MNKIPHDEWVGRMSARINGELDAAEEALFDTHVQSCPACSRELREYELLSRRLRDLASNTVVPALSTALLAAKQEMAQGAQQRLLEEAQQVLGQAFAHVAGGGIAREESARSRVQVAERKQETVDEAEVVDLVKRAMAWDAGAFEMLYKLYSQEIYQYLHHQVRRREDADDLASESFLRAWRGLSRLSNASRFRGWLFGIAKHVAWEHLRSEEKQRRTLQALETLGEEYPDRHAGGFEDQVEEQELLMCALAEVAPKPRACLLLYQQNFSHAEIAELVGIQLRSVGTYISIARKQFRSAYYHLRGP